MLANPVLAQSVRGNWIENRHRGAICLSTADGTVASTGDVEQHVFPRSAIKTMQALAMLQAGADQTFGLTQQAIALACASHNGEPIHTNTARGMLAAVDLDETALECGAHPPIDPAARKALFASGSVPNALHNACSGKHSGMLALARALGEKPHGYSAQEHAVQKSVRSAVELVLDHPLTEARCGIDGCSIPTWAAPLSVFSRGFARMATGTGLSPEMSAAARRVFDAVAAHPFLIGGTGSFDSEIIAAFKGRLIVKFGADGVYCGVLRDTGLGFALKCDDGSVPAATAMVAALLLNIAEPDDEQRAILEGRARQFQRNWAGHEVGYLEATDQARLSVEP